MSVWKRAKEIEGRLGTVLNELNLRMKIVRDNNSRLIHFVSTVEQGMRLPIEVGLSWKGADWEVTYVRSDDITRTEFGDNGWYLEDCEDPDVIYASEVTPDEMLASLENFLRRGPLVREKDAKRADDPRFAYVVMDLKRLLDELFESVVLICKRDKDRIESVEFLDEFGNEFKVKMEHFHEAATLYVNGEMETLEAAEATHELYASIRSRIQDFRECPMKKF
ncbi:hypothetical protein [Rhizobium sp. BR 315]|uniref:hypothetical protein n=1 Tax=Rhizobium sp. BR 315 TaxID=3040014 RepID=UPI003D340CFD